ncbi:hypothetical protein HC928_22040, partial [bacterium]|nr:hypothetical protein [bacterium]
TQPFNPAPSAPSYPAYGQPVPSPNSRPTFEPPVPGAGNLGQSGPQPVRDSSGRYRVDPATAQGPATRWPTDAVTLVLAFMALMAVLCLLPLYFAVLQAYT